MKKIASRCPVGASLNMMDLSVEAEAFGAEILFAENEIPTVTKGVLDSISDAASLRVPEIGAGRTQIYIDGVRNAKEEITHIPVFAGVIGPYSLAGRLFDMTELMMECFDSPDDVTILLEKTTKFIISYIKAFKEAGADECSQFDNFMLSSGCDIPYDVPWENIDAYFKKVKTLYV